MNDSTGRRSVRFGKAALFSCGIALWIGGWLGLLSWLNRADGDVGNSLRTGMNVAAVTWWPVFLLVCAMDHRNNRSAAYSPTSARAAVMIRSSIPGANGTGQP
jgi:hypothetical protein